MVKLAGAVPSAMARMIVGDRLASVSRRRTYRSASLSRAAILSVVCHLVEKASEGEGDGGGMALANHCTGREPALHFREHEGIDDRRVLAAMALAPPDDVAKIEAILQKMRQPTKAEAMTSARANAFRIKRFSHSADRAEGEIKGIPQSPARNRCERP
jgi:hypothetical protein